ncbi:hypothetical protein D7Z26_16810 [Cohnella endophytica]|uniref:SLH domain-containing protein n=1 Tax=Cohnella endophytica TaxID=2419778 RepID=A0A494XNY9_9BACL|nr:S-layer homology domain-containing protein [Cohnella endophytica]RKP51451.1 hypothetical protein D7Z26_16810 [Cohnella endophytica]
MYNIFGRVKQKLTIMIVLALAVSTTIYSGIAMAQGTATSKISANSSISTYGEEVTFTATVLDPVMGGTTPRGTVTLKDGNQNLMTATLTTAEPIITLADKRATIPDGATSSCYAGPDTFTSATCPIIQWGEYTYRAYSYWTNDLAMVIVAYDSSGNIVQQWRKDGARYLWQITLDATAQTITFWGQGNYTITMGLGEFLSASASASFKTSDLAIGSHSITAVFSGDDNHDASESSVMSYTVHSRYTVTYNGNGSTGGNVPTNSGSYNGNKVSVYGNTGNLVKTGYAFAGWNTQANGQGTYYAAGEEGTISSDVMLYAQWMKVLSIGTGTLSDPYQIKTGEELDLVRNYLDSDLYFKLMSDIDLSSYVQGWLPIGGSGQPFQGNMDGNGHKITGLTINRPDDYYVGLFGFIGFNASVKNMKLENVNVTGKEEVGGLVGLNVGGEISNSSATGSVTGNDSSVGGLVGYNYYGEISDSYATGSVTGNESSVGGLVGYNYGEISNSYAAGSVAGNESSVGGLVGDNDGEISNSYAAGSVTGNDSSVGGLIGSHYGEVSNSYATGHVTGSSDDVGGLIGYSDGEISNSFYDKSTTGQSDSDKGDGKTTEEMKMQSTYEDSSWDFTNLWGISSSRNNGYPYLRAIQKFVTYDGNGNTGGISDKVTSSDGKLTLPVGKSGEVSIGDEIKIVIPANATGKELRLTIDKVSDIQTLITNKEILLSSVFEVLKNFTENFDKPVTLTFKFDPNSLKGNEKPVVFYYDEAKKEWVKVGGTVSGNNITVDVNHFTKYAVLAAVDATPLANFSDIATHWAEAGIKQAVSAGIVSGYPDGTFKPNRTVTRAEFAVMLMNALKPQGDGAELKFTDKEKIGSWAQKSVAQAVYAGVINGYEDGSFRPNAEITRAEMAAIIAKALGQNGGAAEATGFADDKDIPNWAKGAVAVMKKLGIIEGKGANRFAPEGKTTRAEAVTVLLKMMAQKSK